METNVKTNKGERIMLVVIGVVLVCVGGFTMNASKRYKEKAEKMSEYNYNAMPVGAVINDVKVESYESSKGTKKRYVAYLSYEVNGVKYENIPVTKYAYQLKGHDGVNAYYNPDNPREIKLVLYDEVSISNLDTQADRLRFFTIIAIAFGGFLIIGGIFGKIRS